MTRKSRNYESRKKHRKEAFWQIIFPTLIVALAIIGIAVWTGFAAYRGSDVRHAADTSMIFLILPVIVLSVIMFISLLGVLFGVIWLNRNMPFYAKRVQDISTLIQGGVDKYSNIIVEPLIRLQSYREVMRRFLGMKGD